MNKKIQEIFMNEWSKRLILLLEAVVLLLTIFAFWHHAGGSTGIREHWYWLLGLAIPFFILRGLVFGRLWTQTILIPLLIGFILLSLYNYAAAPLHRESYLATMARPLLGVWMLVYMTELGRVKYGLLSLVIATIGMGAVLGFVALTTTQWVDDKSQTLMTIINALPRFDSQAAGGIFTNLMWTFNPNEIAGALAWLVPILAAFAVAFPLDKQNLGASWLIRITAGIIFLLNFLALFLGQSRFAIAGVLGSLIIIALLSLRSYWRILALAFVGLIIFFQAALLFNFFPSDASPSNGNNASPSVGISSRDETTFSNRFLIWEQALKMMRDYPTTGVGMGMFRTAVSREPYLISFFVETGRPNPPHVHNEWLQMGADLGVGGLLIYIAWQVAVLYMLWQGWTKGDSLIKVIAIAAFGGLIAHAVYGIGDAVTIWDRFQFILWWLVGMASAQYAALKEFPFAKEKT